MKRTENKGGGIKVKEETTKGASGQGGWRGRRRNGGGIERMTVRRSRKTTRKVGGDRLCNISTYNCKSSKAKGMTSSRMYKSTRGVTP